jgi:hypothetical protein
MTILDAPNCAINYNCHYDDSRDVIYDHNIFIIYYYKSFTIVIYDHSDSGQYYKTMITIISYALN